MGRWLDQWSKLTNQDEKTLFEWMSPLNKEDLIGKKVLDAGCGNGGNSVILAEYASEVLGIDRETTSSPLMFKHPKVSYQKGDLDNLSHEDEFDVVVCVGVLHHMEDPTIGFENLIKASKTNGIIAVWVYSFEGNALLRYFVEPLKKHIILKLPQRVFSFISHFCTFFGYFLAYNPLYMIKALRFLPYYDYFVFWRKYSYSRNYMNVYDKLNAPTTHWIAEPMIRAWASQLKDPKFSSFNGVSWRLSGRKGGQ